MPPTLEQFDSDEEVLLMYLAGELAPDDRATVQRRLTSDEQLRSQLEVLRASQVRMAQLLDALDASQPVPGSAASSQRQIIQMLNQWQAKQLVRNSQQRLVSRSRSKWTWISSAAAAMLLVSWGVWWGTQPDKYAAVSNTAAETSSASEGDDVSDAFADDSEDFDVPFEQSHEYAAMDTNVDYVNALSELTTLSLPPLQ